MVEIKIYDLSNYDRFYLFNERDGALSNQERGWYPMVVNDIWIDNVEMLFQACKFPDYPDIQEEILLDKEGIARETVKYLDKPGLRRDDFGDLEVSIMDWCLRVKLCCNLPLWGHMLQQTGERDIVVVSDTGDDFWGVTPLDKGCDIGIGHNMLGRRLKRLRSFYRASKHTGELNTVAPLQIENFKLVGQQIEAVINPEMFKAIAN
jgi:predicted NAD-dependent protein-ADP-ribosyltransferase YbiA (DUF1768 family)